jgi:hypothetical protein
MSLTRRLTNVKTMNTLNFRTSRTCHAAALVAACFTSIASANLMHVSTNGLGQVLLFPYYTTRNDTVSLLSLVNTSVAAKAVRINVREARGGFIVARLNVYLSAKDVWTAAIIPDGDGAKLVTDDVSCTAPLVGSGLAFDNAAYGGPASALPEALRSRDRTREGYIEVIEMAAIPNATKTGRLVTHVAGTPNCDRDPPFTLPKFPKLTDAIYEPPTADLKPATGQLTGTLSLVNVGQGMLASTAPTVIENFWRTDTTAPNPRVWAATVSGPDLTTGGNRFVNLPRYNADASVASESHYVAEFASSIDAVSALLTAKKVSTEYAFTTDGVIAAQQVTTLPTKPYYVFATTIQPFQKPWDAATETACDAVDVVSYDREEFSSIPPDDFPEKPTFPWQRLCFAANPISYGFAGVIRSPFSLSHYPVQNGYVEVPTAGREGGWLEMEFVGTQAKIVALSASAVERVAGVLTLTPVSLTVQGLPVIGFTMTQSAYKTGSPQQNFGDITPLRREPSYQETR